MILKLYKSSVSLGVILVPLFAVIISLPILFKDFTEVVYYYDWQDMFFNLVNQYVIVNFILSLSILIINAVLINQVFSKTNLFSKATYIPALLYTVFVTFLDVLNFSPSLIIHLLLILFVDQLMKINKGESAIHFSFKSALLIGLMACFSFYYVFVAVVVFITLYTIKSFDWREWFLVLLGVSIPILYLFSAQYIFNNELDLGTAVGQYKIESQFHLINYIQLGCVSLIILVSIKSLIQFYNHNTILSKKRFFVLVVLVLVIISLFLVGFYFFGQIDYSLIVPLALMLAISAISNQRDSLMSLLLTIALVVNIVALFIG